MAVVYNHYNFNVYISKSYYFNGYALTGVFVSAIFSLICICKAIRSSWIFLLYHIAMSCHNLAMQCLLDSSLSEDEDGLTPSAICIAG